MVDIISKRDGPRREDAYVRQLVEQNRATITRIADHLSGGSYSAGRAPRPVPQQAESRIIHAYSSARPIGDVEARVRISLNRRVVVVDDNTGRQLHHLGELRRREGKDVFVLATAANGFFSPVDDGIGAALLELDGKPLGQGYGEDELAADIGTKLGMG